MCPGGRATTDTRSCSRAKALGAGERFPLCESGPQHVLSRSVELFMGYFLSTPTGRPLAAFHKLLKTRVFSSLVCVASNHLFWILHIWKSIQNRKWQRWGISPVPEWTGSIIWNILTLCRNDRHGLVLGFFLILESSIFLFSGNSVLISVFHRQ